MHLKTKLWTLDVWYKSHVAQMIHTFLLNELIKLECLWTFVHPLFFRPCFCLLIIRENKYIDQHISF